MQKERRHPCGLRLLCTYHISETISSPFRGAFHLSLTVLSAIDFCICLALDGGPPSFRPDYTCPTLLRVPLPSPCISLTGLSPSMAGRSRPFFYAWKNRMLGPYNPANKFAVWALPGSLATTTGISNLISFPLLLRCFSSQSDLSLAGVPDHSVWWVSPFGNPRLIAPA